MALGLLKHKKHKVTLIILIALTAVVLILAFLVNQYWSPILSKKLKSVVLTSTDSLYTINFSSAELHVLQGKIILYNIDFKPDTAVYNRRKKQHLAPNNLADLHVKRLILANIHPFKLYFKRVLDIGRITLNSPDVHLSYQLNHLKDTVNKDHRTAWQKISKSLHAIHVGDIFLNDVHFKYDDYSGNKLVLSELKELNVQANDLLIDSATQTDRSRMLYCKDLVADLNNYKGKTGDGLYTYAIKRLKLSTGTQQLNITGFDLQPTRDFFARTTNGRYAVHLDSIQLNHFNFLLYHKYRSLFASSLVINRGSFDIFNNPNGIKTRENKLKSFPNVAIRAIKSDLKIDTVLIRHVNISYSEHNKKSDKTGTINFNNTGGKVLNITTNTAALQKNNTCTAEISSYFMDKGKLSTFFTFDLTGKDAAYTYKGSVGPMNLSVVNPATIPFAMVKITSGTLKSLNFDFKANSKTSKGKVTLLYNDLEVKIFKADTANQKLRQKLIATLFANVFILKHNNPDQPGEIPRSFNVTFNRPMYFPFFKTIWQSLLAGIKPGVGYDIKTQKAATARMAQSDINKKNRKIKKAIRQQKRAERKEKRALKKQQKEQEKAAEGNN
ncbi:MAG TPA: hypothetical protein VL490_11335 [Mucilaginibacter sp.]|jgi:hypothetical protein|nr:hypothetical protein [Mucilaginibacter sp.]